MIETFLLNRILLEILTVVKIPISVKPARNKHRSFTMARRTSVLLRSRKNRQKPTLWAIFCGSHPHRR